MKKIFLLETWNVEIYITISDHTWRFKHEQINMNKDLQTITILALSLIFKYYCLMLFHCSYVWEIHGQPCDWDKRKLPMYVIQVFRDLGYLFAPSILGFIDERHFRTASQKSLYTLLYKCSNMLIRYKIINKNSAWLSMGKITIPCVYLGCTH